MQLDAELDADPDARTWSREQARQFLADYSWFEGFSDEAVEAAIDHLGIN